MPSGWTSTSPANPVMHAIVAHGEHRAQGGHRIATDPRPLATARGAPLGRQAAVPSWPVEPLTRSRLRLSRLGLVRTLLLIAAAAGVAACTASSATTEPLAAPNERAISVPSDATEVLGTTAAPVPTLSAEARGETGLIDLHLDASLDWAHLGISVDGVLRARAVGSVRPGESLGSIWLPLGDHEVCIGELDAITRPASWAQSPESTVGSAVLPTVEPFACTTAAGTLDVPDRLLPDHRIVAHYGTGATEALGILGEGSPRQATQRVVEAANEYATADLPAIPAFEFIATVATRIPRDDNSYTKPRPHHEIRPYHQRIRSAGGLLILDLQPGRKSFLEQARALESFLVLPDVHLALDPEWSLGPDQAAGREVGQTDAEAVNDVLAYVAELVERHGLPEKLLIVHQFTAAMVQDRDGIDDPAGIAVLFHIEAHGTPDAKIDTYQTLRVEHPYYNGFKVYFDEDSRVMTPAEVMGLDPTPLFVSYQ